MTTIDPLSLLIGIALYPVVKNYWHLLISGINVLRDHVPRKSIPQETSVTIDDFTILDARKLRFKQVKDKGFIEFKKYEEGEYVIEF